MRRILFGLILLVSVLATANASTIFVSNFSFELVPLGAWFSCGGGCQYSVGGVQGWTTVGVGGQWIPGGFAGNPGATDGNQLAFIDSGTITQDVGAAVAGATYTLQIDLLHRTDLGMTGVAQLEVGGVTVATATGSDPGEGNWSNWTATYTATAADAGATLTILLSTTGSPGAGQADFDNVLLDSSSVPEPASAALIGIGLLGVAALRRRRSSSAQIPHKS